MTAPRALRLLLLLLPLFYLYLTDLLYLTKLAADVFATRWAC